MRAALDKAWASEKELKRWVHELRAEVEDLKLTPTLTLTLTLTL